MELEHFSHRHPLIFKEELKHDDDNSGGGYLAKVPCCDGCVKQIFSGPFYNCDECDFFLHKSCAELPREIEHPLHPDHPLTLYAQPPYNIGETCFCDACKSVWKNFTYHCSLCSFDLDLVCASLIEGTIEHPSHKHLLKLIRRTSLSICDACGTKHEGTFYACNTCELFCIHRDCAVLSTMIKHTDYHDHPLTLAYSLPSQYSSFDYWCEICSKEVLHWLWVYYCGRCRYFAHVNCATSKTEHFMSIFLPKKQGRKTKIPNTVQDSHLNVVQLPLRNEFVSLVSHFKKDIFKLGENDESKTGQLKHFSHEHPLVLVDVLQSNDSGFRILHDTKYNKTLCNACVTPISTTPFYKCVDECNFVLHKCCAQLPNVMRHPFHPQHSLVLSRTEYLDLFWCEGCQFLCNGFDYSCSDCNYHLDVVCASLPNTIKHEAHTDHLLCLKEKFYRRCNACSLTYSDPVFAFGCKTCDFELHATCAILPSTVTHRYDELHPFTLTYRPVEDHSDDYYCDICEEEMNPRWWFYHCVDCDKSMHTWCHPAVDWRSNVKFGGSFTIESHPHPLTMVPVIDLNTQCNDYVRVITEGTNCNNCGDDFCRKLDGCEYYPMGIKCLECNFNIHSLCLYQLADAGLDITILKEF